MKSSIGEAPFQILLYYLYRTVERPETYATEHRVLCRELDLRGRVLIAGEGLNGTVSGTREATNRYMRLLKSDERTHGIEFKIDPAEAHAFPRLSVKVREEVVTLSLGQEDFSPTDTTGKYLSPVEWRRMMDRDDVVVIDARNCYETEMGHFEGAVLPGVDNFRELPQWVRSHRSTLEGKKILTYCTGGIRCEKFSGYLLREGFENVFQLEGGIVGYGKDPEVQGEKFAGKCYVFDERIGVEVNHTANAQVVSCCVHCGCPCDRYLNCEWSRCNAQFFCCEACHSEGLRYCSEVCSEAVLVSLAACGNESD